MIRLRWVALSLCAVAFVMLWPLWPPLLLAAWTAALMRPLLVRFERGLRGRRRAAAAISLMLFVVLVLPLALIGVGVFSGAQDLVAMVRASPSATSALEQLTSRSEPAGALPSSLSEVLSLAQRSGAEGVGLLTDLAGAAAKALIGVFVYFGGAYVFLVSSAEVWAWLKSHAPINSEHLERLGAAFHETGRGLLVGVGLTGLSQGLAATLVYLALGVPRAWVLGPMTGLASVVPFAGTALVWAPIAVGFFLNDRPVAGIIMLALGVGVISLLDNLLRPVFARFGSLRMPMFLIFVAVFGGLATFGAWGALIGPLVARLSMEALALMKEGEAHDGAA